MASPKDRCATDVVVDNLKKLHSELSATPASGRTADGTSAATGAGSAGVARAGTVSGTSSTASATAADEDRGAELPVPGGPGTARAERVPPRYNVLVIVTVMESLKLDTAAIEAVIDAIGSQTTSSLEQLRVAGVKLSDWMKVKDVFDRRLVTACPSPEVHGKIINTGASLIEITMSWPMCARVFCILC